MCVYDMAATTIANPLTVTDATREDKNAKQQETLTAGAAGDSWIVDMNND